MDVLSPGYVFVTAPFSDTAPVLVLGATLTLLAEIGSTGPIAHIAADNGPADSGAVGEGRTRLTPSPLLLAHNFPHAFFQHDAQDVWM